MNEVAKGISCPKCGCRHLFVLRTRQAPRDRIMRVRECRNCGRTVVTYEEAAGMKGPPAMPDLTPAEQENLLGRLFQMLSHWRG